MVSCVILCGVMFPFEFFFLLSVVSSVFVSFFSMNICSISRSCMSASSSSRVDGMEDGVQDGYKRMGESVGPLDIFV